MKNLKFKAYEIIERAVEEGISYGLNRAYKHEDSPSQNLIAIEIEKAVMLSLTEIIDFEN